MRLVKKHLRKVSDQKRDREREAHARIPGLVSICIANYNKGDFLYECLESVARQFYKPIEIIVVDDCSSDSSLRVINDSKKKFGKRIPFEVVALPRRVGTAWAQNIAYYLSKGEFIANCDSDDVSYPDRILKQVHFLKENDYDLVGCNYSIFHSNSSKPDIPDGGYWLKFDREEIENSYLFDGVHCVCFGSILFKSTIIEKIGGMNKDFIGTEDFDFVDRAASKGFKIGNMTDILYKYRSYSGQRSKIFHGSLV